jgi:hypothetical protein
MADKPPVPGPSLSEKREKTIQLLIDSFASDRLSVEDFETRLDRAHKAIDLPALEDLVSDLPAKVEETTPAASPRAGPRMARPENIRDSQLLVGIMGGAERTGTWTPARKTRVIAFMGGASLDFREAYLPAGVTEVEIFAMMGGAEIIVPPNVRIDSSGVAIMGAFELGPGTDPHLPPDAPVIRVGGFTLMGGVEISVRHPGESARDAKRRHSAERKRLRDERKRLRSGGGDA